MDLAKSNGSLKTHSNLTGPRTLKITNVKNFINSWTIVPYLVQPRLHPSVLSRSCRFTERGTKWLCEPWVRHAGRTEILPAFMASPAFQGPRRQLAKETRQFVRQLSRNSTLMLITKELHSKDTKFISTLACRSQCFSAANTPTVFAWTNTGKIPFPPERNLTEKYLQMLGRRCQSMSE